MIEFITEVVGKFGGRVPGSPEEWAAQDLYKEKMSAITNDVREHEFTAAMNAKFAGMKIFSIGYLISLGLYWYDLRIAAVVAIVNAVVFLGHVVTYNDWLDFLFPKKKSKNITAVLEPKGEVKSTIIIAGHMDSVYEFQWWYKLKDLGGALTFISSLAIVLQAIFYAIFWIGWYGPGGWSTIAWGVFVLLAPTLIVLFTIHGKTKVDGATDNLTGVAMAYATGNAYADPSNKGTSTLQHTRLKLVSFGAEEPGLMGSGAYVRDFEKELKEENALLLNIDSIRELDKLAIVRSELNLLVWHPKELVAKVQSAFEACGVPGTAFDLSIGASDAARFSRKGIPALTIVGIDNKRLDPTYHTRLDTVDQIDPASLDKALQILQHFINEHDRQLA